MNSAKRALWGLSGGHFILDMYAAILIPLYPFIANRLNINLAQISLVIALGHGISSFLQPFWGYISDKLHKRFFMFWGLILVSLFMPVGYIAPSATFLTLCLIIGIAGNAFYHPQVTAIIKNFYNEDISLSRAMGIFLGLGTIGYALGPYLSSFIVEKFNSNFVYIGIIGIITAFFILFFVPKVEKKERKNVSDFFLTLKTIIKNKACMFLIIITIIKACLIMSFGTYIPFLLKEYNFTLTQTGFTMTLFFIAGGLAMIFASQLEKIIKLKGMIIASYMPLLPLVVLAIAALNKNYKILAAILFISIGFFILLAAGCVLACAQKLIPNNTGTISGIIQGFTLAIGSLLLIPLGSFGQCFGVSLILILVSLIAIISAIYCIKTKLV